MNNPKSWVDEFYRARRFPSTPKTRRDWTCNRCGKVVEKGGRIEHSYAADGKICIELCLACVEDLEN